MKYSIGTKLEFIHPEEAIYNELPWKACTVVGETSSGTPIIETEKGNILPIKNHDHLRSAKIRTEWWSRFAVGVDGVPFAMPFKESRKRIEDYGLLSGKWHGEAFSIIVETDEDQTTAEE